MTILKCSTNNRTSTVLESFIAATQNFGLPKKLRTDLGRDDVEERVMTKCDTSLHIFSIVPLCTELSDIMHDSSS